MIWSHQMLRIRSVGEPFTSPRLAFKGAAALARADAMGLLEERDRGVALDATIFGRLAARLRKTRIGGTVVPVLSAVAEDPALFERCLDELNEALEASPVPSTEWSRLLRILDRDALARRLGISPASVRRYAATARETPDDVAVRLHWLALIVGDLAGAYNEIGIRQWFERKRARLGGRAPAQLLIGRWKPDDPGPQQVRALAAALRGSPAT
jgi:hypothetical protein